MSLLPEVNKDLLFDFIDESLDSLSVVESLLVKLETSPDDLKIVDSVFRPVHSIKGNAAYFGLMRIKELSHRMESILDLVRQGRRRMDNPLGSLLLRGLDALKAILSRVRDEQREYDDEGEWAPLIVELESEIERATDKEARFSVSTEMYARVQAFVSRLPAAYRAEANALLSLLQPPEPTASPSDTAPETVERLRASLRSGRPSRLPPDEEAKVFEALEALAKEARSETSKSILNDLRDIARTFAGSAVGLDPLAREMLLEKSNQLETASPPTTPRPNEPSSQDSQIDSQFDSSFDAPPESRPTAATETPKSRSRKEHGSVRTMRIAEESVDRFLEHVGELMGLEEQFRYLGKRMTESGAVEEFAGDLRQATEQFGHLSSKLSSGVMELRLTEARPLLQKVPRLARDVAERTGKHIEVRTSGEEVRLDKSYLELLDAPLLHMVRNACDHGIDSAAERRAAGKPEAGLVEVRILEREDALVMEVCDDGRGLDMEGLRRKAVEVGVLRPDAPFTEADAVALLFRSGVSTAREVTDISGRGVGMDVVKREIEGVGGRLEVRSSPGKGCTFQVILPRSITTRISEGFLFRCGQERFVLPLRAVVETFPAAAASCSQVAGRGATVWYRDEILRLEAASRLLQVPAGEDSGGILVRIRVKDETCVLGVDEALGVQRTVIKPVDEICRGRGIFAGAAMMGDGRLAMVLSEDGLAEWLRAG